LKMVVQSVTILVILVYVNYYGTLQHYGAAMFVRDFFIWATIAITVISGVMYVQRAVALYREKRIAT